MIKRDVLWKGIIEELAEDFLYFFFSSYMQQVDLSQGFEFLDKDLEKIMPEADTKRRHADKLFKAWLKDGREQWFLVHVEVQGYPDDQFAYRMFQYYYRILDRYDKPVTAVAIYTDTNRSYHADAYQASLFGSELIYRFHSFILMDHTPQELRAHHNPFGFALEVARRALDHPAEDDDQLMVSKVDMLRHLLTRGLSKVKIRRLYDFINHYTAFEKLENKLKFEDRVQKITKSRQAMGLKEAILKEVREQGIEQGIQQGIQQGIEQGIEQEKQLIVIRIHEKGLPLDDIAQIVELPVEQVKQIIHDYKTLQ